LQLNAVSLISKLSVRLTARQLKLSVELMRRFVVWSKSKSRHDIKNI
jgi:hypothetical protein